MATVKAYEVKRTILGQDRSVIFLSFEKAKKFARDNDVSGNLHTVFLDEKTGQIVPDVRFDGTRELQQYRVINRETGKQMIEALNRPYVIRYARECIEDVVIQQLREHAGNGQCHWETLPDETEEVAAEKWARGESAKQGG